MHVHEDLSLVHTNVSANVNISFNIVFMMKETQMQRMASEPFSAFAFASLVVQCKKMGTRMNSSRMRITCSLPYEGVSVQGVLWSWGKSLSEGVSVQGSLSGRPPSPLWQTDTCEIITFSQTSFAGNKNADANVDAKCEQKPSLYLSSNVSCSPYPCP